MESKGSHIRCAACGKEWEMTPLGELQTVVPASDETSLVVEFPHIPDWYEFERAQVRAQVEAGTYSLQIPAIVDALPNARNSYGWARPCSPTVCLVSDWKEISMEEDFLLEKPALSMYSCHIEYEYFGKGDCIDLSTLDDTYYIFPRGWWFSVTKIALATEELFAYHSAGSLSRG